ncbi:MAG: hypothetical protein SF187_23855 [Deltaproteobacteria bacterium]|nr:hypothetical protein [Deltaproteobacteria bacterium]
MESILQLSCAMTFTRARSYGLVLTMVFATQGHAVHAATYLNDQVAKAGESISPQHYRVYIPDGVAKVRAVIIHQHGCGRGDWNTAWDVHWRALADKWDAALVAPFLEGDCGTWYKPSNGTWRAYTDALKAIGEQSGHPELPNVPLALWGHSGGGDWVTQMMKAYPDRVAAAVARSGGSDPGMQADGIPALLVRGGDTDIGTDVRTWFTKARARGALVALARDLDQWHECADLRVLAIPFLDAALAVRLPQPAAPSGALRVVNESDGWLGDAANFSVSAVVAFSGDKTKANWLPNEALARKWSEFANPKSKQGTGWVTDTTPPDSKPWDVSATIAGNAVTLAWRARADLDSGIKAFAIFRDGVQVGMLGGNAGTANAGGGFFQWGAFGDEADPGPAMPSTSSLWPFPASWKDMNVSNGAHQYAVATINGSGLLSDKSTAVPVFIGTATDKTPPTLSLGTPVTVDSGKTGSHNASVTSINLAGTASDNEAVASVSWSNDRGASGVASGTTAWSANAVPLSAGANTISLKAFDAAGNSVTTTLVINTTATSMGTMMTGGTSGAAGGAAGASAGGAAGSSSTSEGAGGAVMGVGGAPGVGGADQTGSGDLGDDTEANSGCSCRFAGRGHTSAMPACLFMATLVAGLRMGRKASRAKAKRVASGRLR